MRETQAPAAGSPLPAAEIEAIDAWWRAANYLSVGQIYLLDNPLLREPLSLDHIKPRLLGHWGTTPGLNFLYVHLNRVIRERDLEAMYVIGPGHGAPAILANAYLEGTYTEVYPRITRDEDGMRRFFRQFSFPGGVPSHVAAETPGSIHEGASSATRSPTPTAPPSTIPVWSCSASSAMARQRRAPSQPAGIRTSSWTRAVMGASSRSCT